jgi:hypothetical protein
MRDAARLRNRCPHRGHDARPWLQDGFLITFELPVVQGAQLRQGADGIAIHRL